MPSSNNFYKIISVLIAIILWTYVIAEVDPVKTQTITDVPVQLLNEENLTSRGLAISGEAEYTIDISLQGKRGLLSKISAGDIVANADLFGFSMGKNYIPVIVTVPEGVSAVEVEPMKITVSIEELVEVSKPIKVVFTGTFDEGIEAGQIKTKPEEVLVSGAKSEVAAVSHIKAEVSPSKLTEEGNTIQANAVAVNIAGDVVKNVKLSSSFIDVSAKLCKVKEVPLDVEIVGQVASIYEITNLEIPNGAKIKGEDLLIKEIKSLQAEPVDISGIVSTSKIPVKVNLPEGIEFAEGYEELSVDIFIKPVATKQFTFEANEIKLEGIDGVSNITITTPEIIVTAAGSEAVIRGLKKSDLEPYLELDAESLLSATAIVKVHYTKQLGHVSVSPEEVHITLNQTE